MSWAFVAEGGIFAEIQNFLKAAHEIDEREEKNTKSLHEEITQGYEVSRKSADAEERYEKEDDERMERGRTLSEIRHGLNKKYEEHEIEATLKENEDEIAHWPHPKGKRFTLAEHLESNHYAKDFVPGVG